MKIRAFTLLVGILGATCGNVYAAAEKDVCIYEGREYGRGSVVVMGGINKTCDYHGGVLSWG